MNNNNKIFIDYLIVIIKISNNNNINNHLQ